MLSESSSVIGELLLHLHHQYQIRTDWWEGRGVAGVVKANRVAGVTVVDKPVMLWAPAALPGCSWSCMTW